MKILLIYDSFFGNTEKIANTIAGVLSEEHDVDLYRVNELSGDFLNGIELVIVGSPTRAFRPSPYTMNLLKSLPFKSLQGIKFAAFDTRICQAEIKSRFLAFMVGLLGYADRIIIKALQKKGGEALLPSAGFCVVDSEGPLKAGELERAKTWAIDIVKSS